MGRHAIKFTRRRLCKSLVLLLFAATPIFADQWFDSYPRLKWTDETVRLRLLARHLRQHPEEIAYISCHWKDKNDRKEMERRLHKANKYLVHSLGISAERVVIIVGGQRDYSLTIIQPKELGLRPPDFK